MRTLTADNTSIICPCNDGESKLIIEIAKELSFDVRVSRQSWGAVLSKEPDETFLNLQRHVMIIELPGIEKEEEIKKGHNLFIIDHHKYHDMDRSNPKSAIEQFAGLISYDLNRWEMGIALNDRGYIPALRSNGYTEEEIMKIRRFDLIAQGYEQKDFELLEKDYLRGYTHQKFYFIETICEKTSYLSDLHFFESEKQNRCKDLFILKKRSHDGRISKISFSGSPLTAKSLHNTLGGYCGGDENASMYWGKEFPIPINKEEFMTIVAGI